MGSLNKPVPSWASHCGIDEFGFFAHFEYKGVAQRMRYILPGRFFMGSPESEPHRCDDELRHEVELTKGYWLADTACTQEMWVVVMGENPSTFTERGPGENSRPVENVSWYDCQEFLERLNGAVPGLDFRLPTEAEWEYACRAGMPTPFSFGTNVMTDQVNYDGNCPYAGSEKGKYRAKTVPVKSLPANLCGLFEMHGNVWEWCLDEFAPYEPGLAIDPCRNSDDLDVRSHVVRGGSWFNHARFARSAYRLWIDPVLRYAYLGFRFSQG